jgi:hypothetical protein
MRLKVPRKRSRRRGRWLATIAVVAAAAGITTYGLRPRAPLVTGGTPRLVVDSTTIDFGNVHFYQFVEAVFTLTNAGGGALAIDGWTKVAVAKGC